mmetsp:Transcript_22694/g.51912  ORF Transcript_22694/g.51912 Transcript_22694/m.51912 type:complete len:102 (+) Transcript_22694:64-369(+)
MHSSSLPTGISARYVGKASTVDCEDFLTYACNIQSQLLIRVILMNGRFVTCLGRRARSLRISSSPGSRSSFQQLLERLVVESCVFVPDGYLVGTTPALHST